MGNQEIKMALKENGVHQWELAKAAGYSSWHFCVKMREEFSSEEKKKYIGIIKEIAKSKGIDNKPNVCPMCGRPFL